MISGGKMKVVFFNKSLISGGIEKCLELLGEYLYKDYELEIVYTDTSILDPNIVDILSRYAKVYQVEDGMQINCDICVWCYLYFDYPRLKSIIHAKEYIAWIHSMPRILPECRLDDPTFVEDCSHFICVSEAVKNHLDISKEGEVIHNFMPSNIKEKALAHNPFADVPDNILKLSVVSRLSTSKGFERLLILTEKLKEMNVPFRIQIVGKGRNKEPKIRSMFAPFEEVSFAGYQENPYPYIKNSDYLVQLSDDESWCNSITEAKLLETPVVVTNFESSKEQIIDGYNGIIVDLAATDYEQYINRMLNLKKELRKNLSGFKVENEIDKWYALFNEVDK